MYCFKKLGRFPIYTVRGHKLRFWQPVKALRAKTAICDRAQYINHANTCNSSYCYRTPCSLGDFETIRKIGSIINWVCLIYQSMIKI